MMRILPSVDESPTFKKRLSSFMIYLVLFGRSYKFLNLHIKEFGDPEKVVEIRLNCVCAPFGDYGKPFIMNYMSYMCSLQSSILGIKLNIGIIRVCFQSFVFAAVCFNSGSFSIIFAISVRSASSL